MTEPLYPSRKLSWEEVSRRIQDQLESLLGRPLSCRVFLEDLDYWGLANDTVFTQTEVERLLRATGAGRDEWQENLYPDEEESKSLGMGLSRLLLQQALHGNWETEFCTAESLWLLNYHTVGTSRTWRCGCLEWKSPWRNFVPRRNCSTILRNTVPPRLLSWTSVNLIRRGTTRNCAGPIPSQTAATTASFWCLCGKESSACPTIVWSGRNTRSSFWRMPACAIPSF